MSAHQNQQDLYNILNIPRNASQSQIKSAYRKLALKYHPDKQSSQEEKAKCTEIFTKIGNAYEVLGDPQRREAYDRYGTTDANVSNSGMPAGTPYQQQQQQQNPFTGGFFRGADPFQDPFFTGRHGGRPAGFTDPFDLFQQMFGAEFGHQFHNEDYTRTGRNHNSNGAGRAGAGGFGNFGVGGLGGMMGQHMNAMNNMMNVNVQSSFSSNSVGNRNGGFRTFSSTSTSFGGGGNGVRESVSTSTRIINGKRQTVTERVKVHPDGRVERSTETTGDDDFPSGYLGNGGNNSGHGQRQSLDQQRSNSRSWR